MAVSVPLTYVRVNTATLRRNLQTVREALRPTTRLCAVVKANAYGHGLVPIARLFAEAGCDMLGVASMEEGVQLRSGGLSTPILVFHPVRAGELAVARQHNLTLTLTRPDSASELRRSVSSSAALDYHLEIDVGLGRSGHQGDPREFVRSAEAAIGYPPSGVWAHLGPRMVPPRLPEKAPSTWANAVDVAGRLRYLSALRDSLHAQGHPIAFHVAASGAFCDCPELQWDMVRIGSLLYGVYPSFVKQRPFRLQTALELRTHIVDVRPVRKGTRVGYGAEFRTSSDARLGTIPVGLSHGVGLIPESTVSLARAAKRWLGHWHRSWAGASAVVRICQTGEVVPIVGRISLNECTIDVTDAKGAVIGTEVAVPARMTTLNPLIPRVYVEEDG